MTGMNKIGIFIDKFTSDEKDLRDDIILKIKDGPIDLFGFYLDRCDRITISVLLKIGVQYPYLLK